MKLAGCRNLSFYLDWIMNRKNKTDVNDSPEDTRTYSQIGDNHVNVGWHLVGTERSCIL